MKLFYLEYRYIFEDATRRLIRRSAKMDELEFKFLRDQIEISEYLILSIKELVQSKVKLSDMDFDSIHDQCMEYLQEFGFDDRDQITEQGKLAQKIIDTIFDLQTSINDVV